MTTEEIKSRVGRKAADDQVKSGMKIGMGTGSTAIWSIRRVGEMLRSGEISDILAVPTSFQAVMECQRDGIPLRTLNDPDIDGRLDVTIDGADEVDGNHYLTKGGGAALLMEKVVAYNSDRLIIVVDESKCVEHLGLRFAIPIEVLPNARIPVTRAMEKLGARVELRMAVKKMGPVITDNGNFLLDISFGEPQDIPSLENQLSQIPGVLGNGLFTRVKPVVYVGHESGNVERLR